MKKSFMTRVLATGLSLAMAFSLSAATNVSVASAAAKPAMKSKTMTVKVGQKKNYQATAATQKAYKITKVKMSAAGKTKAKVTINSSKKSIKVEGLAATKGSNVVISFKNNKTKKTTKVTTKVVVKAEKATMTAAATKVKEITLTFSKAVADTTAAKITVKKGNTAPTFTTTWAADAKSAVLAMDSKLSAGTYDITVSGVEKEDLIASVTVEDQKLAGFELASDKLVAKYGDTTSAAISFRAVDQYGERLGGIDASVTVTLGSAKAATYTTSAKKDTKVEVEKIPTALAVVGQTGTITIVDSKTGVNLVKPITYASASKAVKVEVVGIYKDGKKVESLTAGTKVAGHKVALKFVDQYDVAMDADDVKDLEVTVIAGTTNIKNANTNPTYTTAEIGEDKYVVCELAAATGTECTTGTLQITVVNKVHGLLDTLSFDVAPGTVIKSFSVSADNDIFANEDCELSYTAIDADGKEVTSYDVLDKALPQANMPEGVSFKKQKDGSAKLIYNAKADIAAAYKQDSYRGSESKVLTFQLYKGKVNTVVVNATIRVNQARVFWEVAGVNSDKAIAGKKDTVLSFKAEDFKIADQYGNTLSKDKINELIGDSNSVNSTNYVTASVISDGTTADWNRSLVKGIKSKTATMGAVVSGAGVLKIKVASNINTKDTGYELKLSQADTTKASDFSIKWTDDVNTFSVKDAGKTLVAGTDFKVYGIVDGKKVEIPTTQYRIVDGGSQAQIATKAGVERVTKDGTLKVAVDDSDHNTNIITADYKYSNEDAKLAKISVKSNKTNLTSGSTITMSGIVTKAFDLKDQYGKAYTSYPDSLVADVVVTGGKANVAYNTTAKVEVTKKNDDDGNPMAFTEITVTLTSGELSASTTIGVD